MHGNIQVWKCAPMHASTCKSTHSHTCTPTNTRTHTHTHTHTESKHMEESYRAQDTQCMSNQSMAKY